MKALPRSDSAHTASDRPGDRLAPTGLARIPTQGGEPVYCRHCSAAAPERLVRVVGAWSVVDGIAQWDCDSCARARLHEIESRSPAH